MRRSEKLRIIREVYTEWEQSHERDVEPDPEYADNDPSQYPEGIVAWSADPEMDAELIQMLADRGLDL